jgi:biopolymer transport protein ExbB
MSGNDRQGGAMRIVAALVIGAALTIGMTGVVAAQDQSQTPAPAPAAAAPAAPPAMAAPAISPVTPSPATTPPAIPSATAPAASPSVPASTAAEKSGEVPTAAPPKAPAVASATLPRDLSPWGMFMNADIIVKVVMLGLLFASLVTWTVGLAKAIEIHLAKRRARAGVRILQSARSLADAGQQFGDREDVVARLAQTASIEVGLSNHSGREALEERVSWLLERLEIAAGRRVGRGMGILASIGATAPFVGLFGTVWGIMNSFIGISNANTTNLAVVAPGIAEALLATALGLFAAIPAVVIYNVFARVIGGYRALVADAGALVMRLVSRDNERGAMPISRAAE